MNGLRGSHILIASGAAAAAVAVGVSRLGSVPATTHYRAFPSKRPRLRSRLSHPAGYVQGDDLVEGLSVRLTGCTILGFGADGGDYGWVLAHAGSALRSARGLWDADSAKWVGLAPVPPGPVTCAALGIDPVQAATARWLVVDRPGDPGQMVRIWPSSAVCNADLNGDGQVNAIDLGVMRGSFFRADCYAGRCSADLNGDGRVNALDLGFLKHVFLDFCAAPQLYESSN